MSGSRASFEAFQPHNRSFDPFDQDTSFDSHHYAFHVSDAEFDAIFERIKQADFHTAALPGAWTTASSMIGMAAVAFISRIRTVTA